MLFKENSLSLDFSNYKAKKGCLLLAEPFMNDEYFKRSVILLAIHNDTEGSLGFIVNKPIRNISLADMSKNFKDNHEWPVYFGGPVQTSSLFYIHTLGHLIEDSKEICKGIYFGGDFEMIENLVKRKEASPEQIKFFLGYSGWGQNQLEEELMRNSWLTTFASRDIVLGKCNENKCWQKAVHQTPHFYVAHFPQNVLWN